VGHNNISTTLTNNSREKKSMKWKEKEDEKNEYRELIVAG